MLGKNNMDEWLQKLIHWFTNEKSLRNSLQAFRFIWIIFVPFNSLIGRFAPGVLHNLWSNQTFYFCMLFPILATNSVWWAEQRSSILSGEVNQKYFLFRHKFPLVPCSDRYRVKHKEESKLPRTLNNYRPVENNCTILKLSKTDARGKHVQTY